MRPGVAPPPRAPRAVPPAPLASCRPRPPTARATRSHAASSLRLAHSEHLLPRLLPRPATSPPPSALPAPNPVGWRVHFAPSPPCSERRRVERLSPSAVPAPSPVVGLHKIWQLPC
ncbi:hypothetical protein GUJ93_ZPchr0008g12633 [Zizania palustris]|uniref:Uncharacterized protein n=1 Tax=Zizania palustris TaxID=103762 RepID=A0A8J5RZP9_ZIZPA|nr:hypothetical protein GUJ93_ZPchr0008g12633 [Zizania palustris]